jgi:SOS response regulatory protein OraA/RecX
MPHRSAYLDALHLLAGRELTVKQLRDRLVDREHNREEVERAIEHLLESKALDDARVAAMYVRTAIKIKGRGRLRVQRELQEIGVERDVASDALAEAFGDVDERALIANAIKKKLRGKPKITTPAEYARVYQFLLRQGFSPDGVNAALRGYRKTET